MSHTVTLRVFLFLQINSIDTHHKIVGTLGTLVITALECGRSSQNRTYGTRNEEMQDSQVLFVAT